MNAIKVVYRTANVAESGSIKVVAHNTVEKRAKIEEFIKAHDGLVAISNIEYVGQNGVHLTLVPLKDQK
jgi:hypothetical protein